MTICGGFWTMWKQYNTTKKLPFFSRNGPFWLRGSDFLGNIFEEISFSHVICGLFRPDLWNPKNSLIWCRNVANLAFQKIRTLFITDPVPASLLERALTNNYTNFSAVLWNQRLRSSRPRPTRRRLRSVPPTRPWEKPYVYRREEKKFLKMRPISLWKTSLHAMLSFS